MYIYRCVIILPPMNWRILSCNHWATSISMMEEETRGGRRNHPRRSANERNVAVEEKCALVSA